MRTAVPLRRRRSRAQHGVLVTAAALAFVTGGVAAGVAGYMAVATDEGHRTSLASGGIADTVYQVSARGGDLVAADESVVEQIGSALPGVSYRLHHSVVTGPRSLYAGSHGRDGADPDDADADDADADPADPDADTDPDADLDDADADARPDESDADGALARGVFASYPDIAGHADLVAGDWPGRSAREHTPVAVHAAPAARLDLGVGDVLSVADRGEARTYEVVGVWLPADPDDPYWYGQPLEVDGEDGRVDLLLVTTPDALADVPGASVSGRWRLTPELNHLTSADVSALRAALPRIPPRLESDTRLSGARVTVEDGLLAALRDSDDRVQAARSVAIVPLVLLGLTTAVTIGVVARMLTSARLPETLLLRARGASVTRLTRWSLVEAIAVVVIPAGLGTLAAAGLLRLAIGTVPPATVLAAGATAAAVLLIAVLTAAGLRAARAAVETTIERRVAAARSRSVLRAGSVALVVAAAAVGIWQLHQRGTPAVVGGGSIRVDPVAVSAPALALLAGGMIGALAVAATAWVAQAVVRRRPNLSGTLAVRQIARRPSGYALPVILLVMATGAATLAAGFAATWSDLQRDVAAQRTGADLQVVVRGTGSVITETETIPVHAYRAVAGVSSVEPVVSVPRARVGDGAVEVIAAPRDSEAAPATAPGLPGGAREVEIELTVTAHAHLDEDRVRLIGLSPGDASDPEGGARVDLWFMDADGRAGFARTPDSAVPADGEPHTVLVSADVPAGSAPWHLIAIDVDVDGGPSRFGSADAVWDFDYEVEVVGLRTAPGNRTVELGGRSTTLLPEITEPSPTVTAVGALGVHVAVQDMPWSGRLTTRFLTGSTEPEPVAITATDAMLTRFGLGVGDEASLTVLGGAIPVRIDQRITAIAGTTAEHVVTADLRELTMLLLAAHGRVPAVNQVRVWVDDAALADGSAAQAVTRLAGDAVVIDRVVLEDELRGDAFAGLGLVVFWVVSGAAIALAILGLAVAAIVLAGQRRDELPVLRAMGLSAGQQARTRRREQVAVAVLGVGLGAAAGLFVTALAAGQLAGAATPATLEALRPALRIDVVPWLASLATALVAGLVVAIVTGVRVRRAADAAIVGMEDR